MKKEHAIDSETGFKTCSLCKTLWLNREDFIQDENIRIVGYQLHIKNIERGLFLFNHLTCKTTLAIKVDRFSDLYDGPVYTENKHGSESCPAYCLHQSSFDECPEKCSCAYVREILRLLRKIDTEKSSVPVFHR